jgi:DNA-binding IclR family transcriptional regulator
VAVSEEEYEIGLVSIAVPVRSIDDHGAAAINVSLPAARATPEFRDELTRGLDRVASQIDREMTVPVSVL